MPSPSLHEKIGSFSADIVTLKRGHESILEKMDKTEDKRDGQFSAIDERLVKQNEKLDKQKWGIIASTFTAGLAPFVASSTMGQKVVTSLVTYIQHLFA